MPQLVLLYYNNENTSLGKLRTLQEIQYLQFFCYTIVPTKLIASYRTVSSMDQDLVLFISVSVYREDLA